MRLIASGISAESKPGQAGIIPGLFPGHAAAAVAHRQSWTPALPFKKTKERLSEPCQSPAKARFRLVKVKRRLHLALGPSDSQDAHAGQLPMASYAHLIGSGFPRVSAVQFGSTVMGLPMPSFSLSPAIVPALPVQAMTMSTPQATMQPSCAIGRCWQA